MFGSLTRNIGPCVDWPVSPIEDLTDVDNDVGALIVAATEDPRTVYDNATGLQDAMSGSRLVTLEARVHGVYGEYGNDCVDDTVDSYLASGELPETDLTCAG